jgi:hypothetical protein
MRTQAGQRHRNLRIGAAVLGLGLLLILTACSDSGAPPGGGEPSHASIQHAIYTVIDGLNADNEATFLSGLQSALPAAKTAWARCEPAIQQGAEPRFPGQDDPTVAYVIVQVPHNRAAGCDIALYWSPGKHWSMKSWKGSSPND